MAASSSTTSTLGSPEDCSTGGSGEEVAGTGASVGEGDGEGCTASWGLTDRDRTAVGPDDRAADGQAHAAGAGDRPRAERLEDLLAVRDGHAGAVIGHHQRHPAAVAADRHLDRLTGGRVAGGVVEQ